MQQVSVFLNGYKNFSFFVYGVLYDSFQFFGLFIRFEKLEGKDFSINDADYFVFHSPYNKVIFLIL